MKYLLEARQQMAANETVSIRYHKLIDEAELYFTDNFKEIDRKTSIKIGLCDYFRERYPERKLSDEEWLVYFDTLEDKWGNDGKCS